MVEDSGTDPRKAQAIQMRLEGHTRSQIAQALGMKSGGRTLDMADDQAFLLPVVIDATIDVNARVPEKFREVQWTHLPAGEASPAFAERVHRLLAGGAEPSLPVVAPRVVQATVPANAEPAHQARKKHTVSSLRLSLPAPRRAGS